MEPITVRNGGRVWIYCPSRTVTGGPEALHQLARALRDSGIDARMVYYPETGKLHPVPNPYREYDPLVATVAEDEPGDVIVVPEVYTHRLRKVREARKVIWWLSIDNYRKLRRPLEWVWGVLNGERSLPTRKLGDVVHIAQSFYAVEYLSRHGIDAGLLTDYLRPAYLCNDAARCEGRTSRTVLYNPRKGYKFTRKLMRVIGAECNWVALAGMNVDELSATMSASPLYVDFGSHPGRDRMPREAAAHGCCVLTGRRGSAANDVDVPIPSWYKVDETKPGAVTAAAAKIREILTDYPHHCIQFGDYRAWIARQKRAFEAEVNATFRTMPASV